MQYKISVIHPSRNRPEMAQKTYINWLSKAKSLENFQYILSLDVDDPRLGSYLQRFKSFSIFINKNRSAIDAINFGTTKSNGNIILVVSDDFDCPLHWDELLLKELEGKSDYLVKTTDCIQPTLITLPIMDRDYYNRFGYVYRPDYRHMFCDQEMTAVGMMLGKVIKVPITFEHLHYSTGKSKKDKTNIRNDKTWNQGKRVFNERLKVNFDIENPVINYSQIVWH